MSGHGWGRGSRRRVRPIGVGHVQSPQVRVGRRHHRTGHACRVSLAAASMVQPGRAAIKPGSAATSRSYASPVMIDRDRHGLSRSANDRPRLHAVHPGLTAPAPDRIMPFVTEENTMIMVQTGPGRRQVRSVGAQSGRSARIRPNHAHRGCCDTGPAWSSPDRVAASPGLSAPGAAPTSPVACARPGVCPCVPCCPVNDCPAWMTPGTCHIQSPSKWVSSSP